MYKLYLESRAGTRFADVVEALYFRFVFVTKFNLEFGSPVTDPGFLCISVSKWIRAAKGM